MIEQNPPSKFAKLKEAAQKAKPATEQAPAPKRDFKSLYLTGQESTPSPAPAPSISTPPPTSASAFQSPSTPKAPAAPSVTGIFRDEQNTAPKIEMPGPGASVSDFRPKKSIAGLPQEQPSYSYKGMPFTQKDAMAQIYKAQSPQELEGLEVSNDPIAMKGLQRRMESFAQPQTESKPQNEVNPFMSYLNIFSSRIANTPADLGEGWAIASAAIERGLGKLGVPGANKDLKATDIATYKGSENWRKFMDEVYPVNKPDRETFLGGVMDGLGQVVPLALTGGTSAMPKVALQATKAGTNVTPFINTGKEIVKRFASKEGVLAGSQIAAPSYKQAKEQGASEDEALRFAIENYAVGSVVENLPIQSMFSRIAKLEPKAPILNIVKEGVVGGGEEAVTEMWQTTYENWSANRIYNANREIFDGIGEAGSIGGAVGFILNAATTALIGKRARTSDPQERETLTKAITELEQKQQQVEQNNDQLAKNVKALELSSLMGEGLGPKSFGSTKPSNVERRKQAGKVVLAKDKNGKTIEITGVGKPQEDGSMQYTAITPGGKFFKVNENDITDVTDVDLDTFNQVLEGKFENTIDQETEVNTQVTNQAASAIDQFRAEFQPYAIPTPMGEVVGLAQLDGQDVFVLQDQPNGNVLVQSPGQPRQIVAKNRLQGSQFLPFDQFVSQFGPVPQEAVAPFDPSNPVQAGEEVEIEGQNYVVTGVNYDTNQVALELQDGDNVDVLDIPLEAFQSYRKPAQTIPSAPTAPQAPTPAAEAPKSGAAKLRELFPTEEQKKQLEANKKASELVPALGGEQQVANEILGNEPATSATESPSLPAQPASQEQAGLGQLTPEDAPAQPASEGVDPTIPVEKPVNNPNKLDDEEITLEQQFELNPAQNTQDIDSNINEVLSQYSGRAMGKVQAFRYLTELGDLGKQWAQEKGITSKEELDKWVEKAQSKARSGKGAEKKQAREFVQSENTKRNVDEIEQIALQAAQDFENLINQPQSITNDTLSNPPQNEIRQTEPQPETGQKDVQAPQNQENRSQEGEGQKGLEGPVLNQPKKPEPKKKPSKKTPEQLRKQEILDREPTTARGFARQWLLNGGKLNSTQSAENRQKGVGIGKGVRDETGMSGREMRSLIGIIDNKNGLSPEVAAERIHETMNTEMAQRISVQDLRNALIEVILSEDRKQWYDLQDAETKEDFMNEYDRWVMDQLTPEEIAEFDARQQEESYWEYISENIDELAKQWDEFEQSEAYQQYIEEVYGQIEESGTDGQDQSDEGDFSQTEQQEALFGTDGNGAQASGQQQGSDSPDASNTGKPQSERGTGTGNDSGKPFLNLNPSGNFTQALNAGRETLTQDQLSELEANGRFLDQIMGDYPQLTQVHENEIFDLINSGADRKKIAQIVANKANTIDFDASKPLNLSKQAEASPVTKRGEIERQIKEIQARTKKIQDLAKKRPLSVLEKAEIAAMTKEVNRLQQQYDQAQSKQEATKPVAQGDLFAGGQKAGDLVNNPKENPTLAKQSQEDEQTKGRQVSQRSAPQKLRVGDEGSIRAQAAARLQNDDRTNPEKLKGLSLQDRNDLERKIIFDFAKENNLWIGDVAELGEQTGLGGVENTIFINPQERIVYKSNNLSNSKDSVSNLLEQVRIHNEIFPENQLEVIGFTGLENQGKRPYVEVVMKQEFIPNATQATEQEITAYMNSIGYKPTSKPFEYFNGQFTVGDLRPRNVLRDLQGGINVIDNIITENLPKSDKSPADKPTLKAAALVSDPASQPVKEQLQDVGEKIGGAKKDGIRKYFDKINLNGRILSNIFPKPDIASLLDSGMKPRDVGAIKVAYEFAVQDKKEGPEVIKFYAAYAKTVLAESINLEFKNERYIFSDYGKSQLELRSAAYEAVHDQLGKEYLSLDLSKARILEMTPEIKKRIVFSKNPIKDFKVNYYSRGDKYFDTKEEAIQQFVEEIKANTKLDAKEYKYKPGIFSLRRGGGIVIGLQRKGKEFITLKDGFKDVKEASEYLKSNIDDIQLAIERILAEQKTEGAKPRVTLKLINETSRDRVGKDWREGKDVTSKEFADTFGFRGVEFGNWVNMKERQAFVNATYDSFMDLAQLMNITPEAISLGKELAITFGSRGSGQASAHYEPGRKLINLTKTKGLGSLAHEWFHGVDNYFAGFGSDVKGMKAATLSNFKDGVRPEIKAAFDKIYKAIESGQFRTRSMRLDQKKNMDYYATKHEMAARAFENYVLTRLNESGQVNDFLANYVSTEDWRGEPNMYPYPIGDETIAVREAFDELANTLKVDKSDPKQPLYMIIGEQGATRLDQIEEATVRMDNLAVARQMEAEGIQPVFDAYVKAKAETDRLNKDKDYTTDREVFLADIEKMYQVLGYSWFESDQDIHRAMQEAADKNDISLLPPSRNNGLIRMATGWERGADGKWRYEVDDYLTAVSDVFTLDGREKGQVIATLDTFVSSELNKAYPQLKEVMARVNINPSNEGRGNFQTWAINVKIEGRDINVYARNVTEAQSILLHEIQHAIQAIEGFAGGANVKLAIESQVKKIEKQLSKINKEIIELGEQRKNLSGEAWDENVAKHRELVAEREKLENKISDFQTKEAPGYIAYRSVAGEVEARNVQWRAGLSPEERRANTLQSTEDVAREDQIFLESAGVQMSESAPRPNRAGDLLNRPATPTQAKQLAKVQAEANRITGNWKNGPAIEVYPNGAAIEAAFPQVEFRDMDRVPGLFYDGKVILNAAHPFHNQSGGTETIILHESIGHFGMGNVINELSSQQGKDADQEYARIMQDVYDRYKDTELMQYVAKTYFGKDPSTLSEAEQIEAGEEYIAHTAQTGVKDKWIDGVIAKIREILRKLGFKLQMADAELRAIIGRASRFVVDGPSRMQQNTQIARAMRTTTPEELYVEVVNGFYSPIEQRILDFKQPKASATKWKEIVGKKDEAQWTGVYQYLDGLKPDQQVTKQELLDWMKDNRVRIEVIQKGGKLPWQKDKKGNFFKNTGAGKVSVVNLYPGFAIERASGLVEGRFKSPEEAMGWFDQRGDITNETKYHQYQLEGDKTDYKEVLVTLPNKVEKGEIVQIDDNEWAITEPNGYTEYYYTEEAAKEAREKKVGKLLFKSSHFDEPNILVHLRMNTRTDAEGNKVLFLEEVQSDWGQKGKREGFNDDSVFTKEENEYRELNKISFEREMTKAERDRWNDLDRKVRDSVQEKAKRIGQTPLAPFVTDTNSWVKLGLKVAMQEAVAQGADRIAWTTGTQQNERYDLSKQVDKVRVRKLLNMDDTYSDEKVRLSVYPVGLRSEMATHYEITVNQLPEYIGKDLTDKIMIDFENGETVVTKEGLDLKVGGTGMKAFYGDPSTGDIGIVGRVAESLVGKGSVNPHNFNEKFENWYQRVRSKEDPTWIEYQSLSPNQQQEYIDVYQDEMQEIQQKGRIGVQHSIPVTPALIDQVQSGLPMFMRRDADQTQTPEFKAWFGDSKVVDENGKPKIMYHGTNSEFTEFNISRKGSLGAGIYLTPDKETALKYGKIAIPLYVKIENPKIVNTREEDTQMLGSSLIYRKKKGMPSFDGVIDQYGQMLVLDSTQLKSATGNIGTFSPTNPDIRYTMTPSGSGIRINDFVPADKQTKIQNRLENSPNFLTNPRYMVQPAGVETKSVENQRRKGFLAGAKAFFKRKPTLKEKKNKASFRENIQDAMLPGRRMLEAKFGKNIPEEQDFYTKENLAADKVVFQIGQMENKYMNPIKQLTTEIQDKYGVTFEQIEDYLIALHNQERRDELMAKYPEEANANKDSPEWPTGMTTAEANEIIQAYEGIVPQAERDQLNGLVKDLVNFSLDKRKESGLISEKYYTQLKNQYKNYVPLRGFDDHIEYDVTKYSPLKQAKGRKSKAASPLAYLYADAADAIAHGERNKVFQSVLEFAKKNPDKTVFEIQTTFFRKSKNKEDGSQTWIPFDEKEARPSKEELEKGTAIRGFSPDIMKDIVISPLSERSIPIYVNGQRITIQFKPGNEQLVKALKNTAYSKIAGILKVSQKLNRFLSSAFTEYSPEFGLVNAARDFGMGGFSIIADDGVEMLAKTTKKYPKAWNQLRGLFWNQPDIDSVSNPYLKEFMESGAFTGFSQAKEVREIYDSFANGSTLTIFNNKIIDFIGNGLSAHNKSMENALRFAYFQALRESGMIVQKAAAKAKNVTVNFRRRGNMTSNIGALYAFFNASVQGIERFTRPFFMDKSTRRKAQAMAGTLFVSGFMQGVLFNLIGDIDEEDDELKYDKIPDYTKAMNLILPAPTDSGYFTVPLGYGINVPFALGELLSGVILGKTKPSEAVWRMLTISSDSFSPLGGYDFDDENRSMSQKVAQFATPTYARPILDLAINTNFAGFQIVQQNPWDKGTPNSQNFKPTTSTIAVKAAQLINSATGGDEVVPGLVDINPTAMEYLVRQYGGGPLSFAQKITKTGELLFEGENPLQGDGSRKVPFASRFYQDADNSSATTSSYFKVREQVQIAQDRYEKYLKADKVEEADRFYQKNQPLIEAAGVMEDYDKALKALKKEMNAVRDSDPEYYKELKAEQEDMMKEFNQVYRMIKGEKQIRARDLLGN